MRIKELLAALPKTTEAVHASLDEGMLNMMLGAAFSLWKTVIQADHHYDQATALSGAQELVDEVARNDTTIHAAELNAWLLGYYLSDARLRLAQVAEHWPIRQLDRDFLRSYRLTEIGPSQPMFTPERWGQCLTVLQNLLVAYERRAERTRPQAQTQSEIGSADSNPKRPPVIVGDTDGTYAILRSDGAAASFVDGKWQPGIAFESRDFLDMSEISNLGSRSILLTMAAEAMAKSLEEHNSEVLPASTDGSG
ncbi:MAG: hypothetical protein EKK31_18530 [Hyphomicrobiales bacterium]|nr:MAG: hypothetical protein EKK31_18530 [Hyphomicrobiales bacterium]